MRKYFPLSEDNRMIEFECDTRDKTGIIAECTRLGLNRFVEYHHSVFRPKGEYLVWHIKTGPNGQPKLEFETFC